MDVFERKLALLNVKYMEINRNGRLEHYGVDYPIDLPFFRHLTGKEYHLPHQGDTIHIEFHDHFDRETYEVHVIISPELAEKNGIWGVEKHVKDFFTILLEEKC